MSVITEHEKINGEDYRKLIINAAQCLEDNKEEINELNVFPVPDGDTGSNMSMTVGNAAKELMKTDGLALDKTAEKTAKAMLHGARGNSGVILSLLFRGISNGLANATECDGVAWAKALEDGVKAAYKAVEHPAEGTILTVARCCADAAKKASLEKNSFEYVLTAAINEAEKALKETVKQNPVLEKAGVVDAGGKGWLLVMQSMRKALDVNGPVAYTAKEAVAQTTEKADFSSFDTEDIKFAFCTEFIIHKHDGNADSSEFKKYLGGIGDSLVMIDDGEIIKVHVHTNAPHDVLGEALKWGVYETVKVENMKNQHTNKIVEQQTEKKAPLKEYGFVAVASGEGLAAVFSDLGVDKIVFGGQTMNPSTEDIYKAVSDVNAKTVFVLPNNKNIILAATQAAELSDKQVIVIPTKSIPQGFSAMLGYDEEANAETNEKNMSECALNVDTMQITYAARNSNYDGLEIAEGDLLAMYNDKLVCTDKNINALFEELAKRIKDSGKQLINMYYGSDITEDEANKAAAVLGRELGEDTDITVCYGAQPVYYYIISAE